MFIDRNVVVEIDRDLLPFRKFKRLRWQRVKRGLIEPLEELVARDAAELPHGSRVQLVEQRTDPTIQRLEREERLAPQPRQDPPLHDLYGHFNLGLVARLVWPRRNDCRPVVTCKLLVRSLDADRKST